MIFFSSDFHDYTLGFDSPGTEKTHKCWGAYESSLRHLEVDMVNVRNSWGILTVIDRGNTKNMISVGMDPGCQENVSETNL